MRYRRIVTGIYALIMYSGQAYAIPSAVLTDLTEPSNTGDYLIITHAPLVVQAERLAAYRAAAAYDDVSNPKIVDVADIYAQFPDSTLHRDRVRDFIRYACTQWASGPRYVLFLGDAARYDSMAAVPSYIKERNAPDSSLAMSADDDWLITGDDGLLVMTGRIPARTAQEAANVIDKIIAYETGCGPERAGVCIISDDDMNPEYPGGCESGIFLNQAEEALHTVPAYFRTALYHSMAYAAEASYTDPISPLKPRMTAGVMAALNNGTGLLQLLGHGGRTDAWSHEGVLLADSMIVQLDSGALFQVNALSCEQAAFQYDETCFGEKLLFAPGRGAVAFLGFTDAAGIYSTGVINRQLMDRLGRNDASLGEGIRAVKGALGSYQTTLSCLILLGDPATVVHRTVLEPDNGTAVTGNGNETVYISGNTDNITEGRITVQVLRSAETAWCWSVCSDSTAYTRNREVFMSATDTVTGGRYDIACDIPALSGSDSVTVLLCAYNATGVEKGAVQVSPGAALADVRTEDAQPALSSVLSARRDGVRLRQMQGSVYSLAGRPVNMFSVRTGTYIIRRDDGSTGRLLVVD